MPKKKINAVEATTATIVENLDPSLIPQPILKKEPEYLSDLILDRRNANKHNDTGMMLLQHSLYENGYGRSILISKDNEIIAGNGVVETILSGVGEDGEKPRVKIVETDGREIIAVKRMDINSDTKEFYKMALADNIVAKHNIVMDAEVVEAIAEDYDVGVWKDDLGNEYNEEDNDIQRVVTFGENVNFVVKCKNMNELAQLHKLLRVEGQQISFDNFLKAMQHEQK
jgi:hypothetical protein